MTKQTYHNNQATFSAPIEDLQVKLHFWMI